MKLGVNVWVWTSPVTTEDLAGLLPRVTAMGFDWIEVPIENWGDLDYQEGARMIRDYGLGVSVTGAMGPGRDLIHPDPAIRENGMRFLRRCIEACEILGAGNLVGPFYSSVGRTWQSSPEERARDMDLLVENLGRLAHYAHDHGVVLGLEPLNRFETSFINLAAQAIEVVDRVDHPACRILLDTFHMNIEEKSLGDAIRAVGPRLCHLHACENDRGAPGSGHIPWGEVAQALHEIGYAGPVVIESFTAQVQSIARAAAIWRPLAESQDALAQEGLAFLRKLLSDGEERGKQDER